MFKECKTFRDQAECVASLAGRCSVVLDQFRFEERDVRHVALSNIRMFARNGQLVLNLLDTWTVPDEAIGETIAQLLNVGVTAENVRLVGNTLNTTSRLSLVVLSQFQVENCLRHLASELHVTVTGRGFYNLAEALVRSLRLPNEALEQLNVPALIRNSLHSNGLHRGYQGSDSSVEIDGVRFEFKHGQAVDCANWQHIAHALEHTIVLMGRMFGTSGVRGLRGVIFDPFSSSLDA